VKRKASGETFQPPKQINKADSCHAQRVRTESQNTVVRNEINWYVWRSFFQIVGKVWEAKKTLREVIVCAVMK
jgi:hypothetical protein